ncbi:MAG TPA: cell division protein ZapA [Longimicrobium sp.]|nr:cell division protein ZapA [Longimicrobium sp.]
MSPRKLPARHTVTVEIAGERHVLRSDVPPEYTRAVADHVDRTIRGLPAYPTLEPVRAVMLAALSITDELFKANEEIDRLRAEITRRTADTATALEEAVAESSDPGRPPPRKRSAAAPSPDPAAPAEGGTGSGAHE